MSDGDDDDNTSHSDDICTRENFFSSIETLVETLEFSVVRNVQSFSVYFFFFLI